MTRRVSNPWVQVPSKAMNPPSLASANPNGRLFQKIFQSKSAVSAELQGESAGTVLYRRPHTRRSTKPLNLCRWLLPSHRLTLSWLSYLIGTQHKLKVLQKLKQPETSVLPLLPVQTLPFQNGRRKEFSPGCPVRAVYMYRRNLKATHTQSVGGESSLLPGNDSAPLWP